MLSKSIFPTGNTISYSTKLVLIIAQTEWVNFAKTVIVKNTETHPNRGKQARAHSSVTKHGWKRHWVPYKWVRRIRLKFLTSWWKSKCELHESTDPLRVANTHRSFSTNLYWRLMRKDGLGQRVEVKTHCNWEKVKKKQTKNLYPKGEGGGGRKQTYFQAPIPILWEVPYHWGRELSHERPSNHKGRV